MLLSLLVYLIAHEASLLNGSTGEDVLLVCDNQRREVSAAHLTPLEKRACQATLVHLNELDKVLQGELLPLDHLFILLRQICHPQQVLDVFHIAAVSLSSCNCHLYLPQLRCRHGLLLGLQALLLLVWDHLHDRSIYSLL